MTPCRNRILSDLGLTSYTSHRCFIRNDTDRRLKEEILLASNRIMKKEAEAKSAFIRHVFHEMRTPLHVLATFLHSYNPSPEDFQEMQHHTGSSTTNVTLIIIIS